MTEFKAGDLVWVHGIASNAQTFTECVAYPATVANKLGALWLIGEDCNEAIGTCLVSKREKWQEPITTRLASALTVRGYLTDKEAAMVGVPSGWVAEEGEKPGWLTRDLHKAKYPHRYEEGPELTHRAIALADIEGINKKLDLILKQQRDADANDRLRRAHDELVKLKKAEHALQFKRPPMPQEHIDRGWHTDSEGDVEIPDGWLRSITVEGETAWCSHGYLQDVRSEQEALRDRVRADLEKAAEHSAERNRLETCLQNADATTARVITERDAANLEVTRLSGELTRVQSELAKSQAQTADEHCRGNEIARERDSAELLEVKTREEFTEANKRLELERNSLSDRHSRALGALGKAGFSFEADGWHEPADAEPNRQAAAFLRSEGYVFNASNGIRGQWQKAASQGAFSVGDAVWVVTDAPGESEPRAAVVVARDGHLYQVQEGGQSGKKTWLNSWLLAHSDEPSVTVDDHANPSDSEDGLVGNLTEEEACATRVEHVPTEADDSKPSEAIARLAECLARQQQHGPHLSVGYQQLNDATRLWLDETFDAKGRRRV